jgi:cytochrome c-type biogenesis protein CcsB
MKDFSAIGDNNFNYTIKFDNKKLNLSLLNYQYAKKGMSSMGLITIQAKIGDEILSDRLVGKRGQRTGVVKVLNFKDGIKVSLAYGSRPLTIPFEIKLNDFILKRYAGSMAPSSYSSKITLIDKANNKKFDFHIYMNHILHYDGYKFFQSSYDPDEKGTVLSVNHDTGYIPTYIGYFLLTLGLIMNLFDKDSRFRKLTKYIAKMNNSMVLMIALLIGYSTSAYSDTNIKNTSDVVKYLENYKVQSKEVADQFGHLVVQASMGTMKPIDSLSIDILHKLTRKGSFLGMDANQVVLGMLARPDIWKDIKILKIKTPKLKKYLGLPKSRQYVAFSEILTNNNYKLRDILEKVNKIDPNKRGTFEKDVIRLDERLNIVYMIFYSDIFKIFPTINDNNNKWQSPITALKTRTGKDKEAVRFLTTTFIGGVAQGDYKQAEKGIQLISLYQQKLGKNIIPSQEKINAEITFNKLDIFPRLTIAYLILGLLMFILAFITVFNQKLSSKKLNSFLFIILATLLIIQTFGMGVRWYISGHAPWSNTYESLVYIAWSTMFAGVVFFRKSLLALSATVVMSAIFMFVAHLSGIDPQITNLVPVLKSYWLTIHVAIITGSYGFLGLGAMLGFMTLILFIFRDKSKPYIDKTIKHITAINEASLIIGLSALVVGNFLGGVWANESWGRYWGWDPKETWAYVSIVVYIIVLHLRLVPKLNRPFIFAVSSTLAFASILMTYFGVNFYLSGMHSYATGDPVPIPTWVYIVTAMVFVVISIASRKRDLGVIKV